MTIGEQTAQVFFLLFLWPERQWKCSGWHAKAYMHAQSLSQVRRPWHEPFLLTVAAAQPGGHLLQEALRCPLGLKLPVLPWSQPSVLV